MTSMSRSTILAQCQSIDALFAQILDTNFDIDRVATDALDRFDLWKAVSGAENPPESSSSLETRLLSAPYLVENIFNLLQSLEEALQDAITIIVAPENYSRIIKEVHEQDDQRLEDIKTGKVVPANAAVTTEVEDLLGLASDTIGSLLRLVSLIRQVSSQEPVFHGSGDQHEPLLDSSFTRYIKERLPRLSRPGNRWLLERLGRAIVVQRQRFSYYHTHDDLKPYICCVEGKGQCDSQIFGNKTAWLNHELKHHWRQWTCVVCRKGPFEEFPAVFDHLDTEHPELTSSNAAVEAIKNASQCPIENISKKECPFCYWDFDPMLEASAEFSGYIREVKASVPIADFCQHIAVHLEQLALFAIPRSVHDSTEPSTESNRTQEPTSPIRSLASAFGGLALGFASLIFTSSAPSLTAEESLEPTEQLLVSEQSPETSDEGSKTYSALNIKGKETDTAGQMSEQDPGAKIEVPSPKIDPAPPEEQVGFSGYGSGYGGGYSGSHGKGGNKKSKKVEIWICCQCGEQNTAAANEQCWSCHNYRCGSCTTQLIKIPKSRSLTTTL